MSFLQEPDRMELLTFFGTGPESDAMPDGPTVYRVQDARGVELRFSFHALEASVQTDVSKDGALLVRASSEGATRLWRDGTTLRGSFAGTGWHSSLELRLDERIQVLWSLLRT